MAFHKLLSTLLCTRTVQTVRSSWCQLHSKYDSNNRLISLGLVTGLCTLFLVIGLHTLSTETNPEDYDTVNYLGEANFIKHHGGISNFIKLCVSGKYEQANQHPLYILVLSTFASRDISFFINAKIASLLIGLGVVLLLYFLARKRYGDLTASLAVLGLVLSPVFKLWTVRVASESLLIFFSVLCMYFIITGFEKNRHWLYAGTAGGLAYLTKGTGLFLFPGFLISTLAIFRHRVFKNKYVYVFFLAFILTASPLLIRNVVVYGNPFFNVNTHQLSYNWEDLNESMYFRVSPERGAGGLLIFPKKQTAVPSDSERVSPRLPRLTQKVANKILTGVPLSADRFLQNLTIWPFQYYFRGWSMLLVGIPVFALFILGVLREGGLGPKLYILVTFMTFFVAISLFRPWPRYFLAYMPIFWLYAALGLLSFIDLLHRIYFRGYRYLDRTITGAIIAGSVVVLGYMLATKPPENPRDSVEYSDSRKLLLHWLRTNLRQEDRYTEGPKFNWQLEKGTEIVPPRNYRYDFTKFNSYAQMHDIRYVIIDWYSLTVNRYRRRGDRRAFIDAYFEFDSSRGIVQKGPIPGWELVYKDPHSKVEALVFKIIN